MKKLLFIFCCSYLAFCSNSTKKRIKMWNSRLYQPIEECITRDSLINLNLLPLSCACKNIKLDKEEFCDSLLIEYLNKHKH